MKPITLIFGVILLVIAFFHKQLFSSVATVSTSSAGSSSNAGGNPIDTFVPRPSGGFGNEYGVISPTDPLNNQGGLFKDVSNPLFLNY